MRLKPWIVFAIVLLARHVASAADWKPVPGNIMTRWVKDLNPQSPLPEYPRPQLQRGDWKNLNGLWEYSITTLYAARPEKYDGQILVPFPLESALSGVKKPLTATQRLWYRRTFAAPDLSGGKRLLLHFGAVDWESMVFVNGKEAGSHRGGFDAFTFDITDAVKVGAENELVVSVFDETDGLVVNHRGTGIQVRGKQKFGAVAGRGSIRYTPCSGIWQTVWLETVPAVYIESLRITPEVDNSSVVITVNAREAGQTAKLTVFDGSVQVATAEGKVGEKIVVKIPQVKTWSPDAPFLYDLKVALGSDEVAGYFGMRTVTIGKDEKGIVRPMLNGKFVFQSGPLDQGYWPDGIYTAPTDEALRFDIEITKKLGFNMARKHVKIEPQRWYYWADKLGLLVWQDMPSAGAGSGAGRDKQTGVVHDGKRASDEANAQFETELKAMVDQNWNHPSIIMWIVFNEGWGQYETPRLTNLVKDMDPSRLVNNASGGHDVPCGDVVDIHVYPGPACPKAEPTRMAVLGEFGGFGLGTPGHTWVEAAWGYRGVGDPVALTAKYCEVWRRVWQLKDEAGLCGAVYTQTTDVEAEANGLLTYDREIIKVDVQTVSDANQGKFSPPPAAK